ncbi:hypothetical protein BD626DRAFT_626035 [Schizophyllum amplum]|uniref:Uncharacterized protein n=1 Tax=Schizophyllum amplum TaxID=97359 RepID=A0A550CS23_9AGAR|nr:hypothetical protein BD626DRAFT_626035 [Auriculariopsis ampla]
MPKVNTQTSKAAPNSFPAYEAHLRKPRKIMSRKFITKHIVLLHCKQSWDTDEIRLQFRDGTSLPRPNMIGFKLIDCCDKREQGWNGYGNPMVYVAELDRDGAYKLFYEGKEVWACSGRPLGREPPPKKMTAQELAAQVCCLPRIVNNIELRLIIQQTAERKDYWDRCLAFQAEACRQIIAVAEADIVLRNGPSVSVDNIPRDPFAEAPPGMFIQTDVELTHRLRQHKKRTGDALCINRGRHEAL